MPVCIIVNPVSGSISGAQARDRISQASAWRDPAGQPVEVVVTERAGHAGDLARHAAAQGATLVIAWGGDGTINEVAAALAFGQVPMAIVPAGSGNGLARALGIDPRPGRALTQAARARPKRIDLGEIGGRLFVNIAGIGFDAEVAARFNAPGNVRRGLAAYASITMRMLVTYRPARYRVAVGEEEIVVPRGLMIGVANGTQFGNGARIAPAAVIDDGALDLVIVEERSRPGTILSVPRLFNGTVAAMRGYSVRRVASATIRADHPMVFHVDGEPIQGGTEVTARVHPGALLLAVP
jgi:diacylglycerol kinase (ATP)